MPSVTDLFVSMMARGARMLAAAGILVAAGAPAAPADQNKPAPQQARKLDQDQQREVQALVQLVDKMSQGQPAPSDVQLTWENHFLKAQEGRTYVPFTLSVPDGSFPTGSVALYLRVVNRATAPPAATPPKKEERKKEAVQYAFEDAYFLQLPKTAAPSAGPATPGTSPTAVTRVRRAFAVPAGDYDVYVAIKELEKDRKEGQPLSKAAVLKQALSVPDFTSGELSTSSIIVADKVETLTAPLTPDQQIENPYTFGTMRITPVSEMTFSKAGSLNVIFIVYNPGVDEAKKPNVSVEYNFHQKTPEGEKFFNKTRPQEFNAATLPPQFNLEAGHQLVGGQEVPLATFQPGQYRLEIKITDAVNKKSITREVNFTVG